MQIVGSTADSNRAVEGHGFSRANQSAPISGL